MAARKAKLSAVEPIAPEEQEAPAAIEAPPEPAPVEAPKAAKSTTTYRPKAPRVEAVEFTAVMGAEVAEHAADAENRRVPQSHPSGVTFEPGKGYRVNGQTLRFGDYVVTSRGRALVMSRGEFHDTYEVAG